MKTCNKIITTCVMAVLVLLTHFVQAQSPTIAPGKTAPDIALINIDGKIVSLKDYPSAKGFIVVFTCNTCPYSRAYEQRIIALNNKYLPLGFPVIAIDPNDPESSPGDTFERMKEHAKSARFNFPYLYDKGQAITNMYGAKSTPHVFVISKTSEGNIIEYTGAIDNDTQNEDPGKTKYVEDALAAIMTDKKPAVASTKAIGCTVKWKN